MASLMEMLMSPRSIVDQNPFPAQRALGGGQPIARSPQNAPPAMRRTPEELQGMLSRQLGGVPVGGGGPVQQMPMPGGDGEIRMPPASYQSMPGGQGSPAPQGLMAMIGGGGQEAPQGGQGGLMGMLEPFTSGENRNALTGLGLGLMAGTRQNPFGGAMQGFMAGQQQDAAGAQTRRTEAQAAAQQQQLAALLVQRGMDPAQAAGMAQFPQVAAQYLAPPEAPQQPEYQFRDVNGRLVAVDPRNPENVRDVTPEGMPQAEPEIDVKGEGALRGEVRALPSFKNYEQARPIYESMIDAAGRDTKASDLNLVVGLGKLFDPTSVVREGEVAMVQNAQGLPQRLMAAISEVNSGARLSPQLRAELMAEAQSRMQQYEGAFQRDTGFYRDNATEYQMDPDRIIPQYDPLPQFDPSRIPNLEPGQTVQLNGASITRVD